MNQPAKTREPQYQLLLDVQKDKGIAQMGIMANEAWQQDPRRLVFVLARYKFVSKMLSGKDNVLEIGCADAFGTRIVQQEVNKLTAVDFDPLFLADAQERVCPDWPMTLLEHDMLKGPVPGQFDAAFTLDVLEHIQPKDEALFMKNIVSSLKSNGVLIVGCPSLESQVHASPQSKAGHVNCKTGATFKQDLEDYFENVFLFSMNDEVVHTGYTPMAHYLFGLCVGPK
jgi:2-polyprenyl-3-methyl-5-hydroxy-6-metoxy-1,4-benzoquinol methylase